MPRSVPLTMLVAVLLVSTLGAQVDALILRPGPGCGAPEPQLSITPPVIGAPMTLTLESVFPNAPSWVWFSVGPVTPATIPGTPCEVYIDYLNPANVFLFDAFVTDANGNKSWTLTGGFPDPSLLGDEFVLQTRVCNPAGGGPLLNDYLSNGIGIRFGDRVSGNGCTPGYWKQSHHFFAWPSAHLPSDPFSSVFFDAFPGMSLVDVLHAGGGGMQALGRHAVAAYLNASSGTVGSLLTPAEVVSMFSVAAQSADAAVVENLKDAFEDLNQLGCNL